MDSIAIIKKYYDPSSAAYAILLEHSCAVTDKALTIARKLPELKLDIDFIEEASMIHDIGIFLTNAPEIDCHGTFPYICHGYLGADIITREGYPKQALICERHTGTGLSLHHIIEQNLPIPHRDMCPKTLEEQLICFADKFYSKGKSREKTIDEVRKGLLKHGSDTISRFDLWCELFL